MTQKPHYRGVPPPSPMVIFTICVQLHWQWASNAMRAKIVGTPSQTFPNKKQAAHIFQLKPFKTLHLCGSRSVLFAKTIQSYLFFMVSNSFGRWHSQEKRIMPDIICSRLFAYLSKSGQICQPYNFNPASVYFVNLSLNKNL